MLAELTQPQIEHFLREQVTGRLGCLADGQIYVVPLTFVFDGKSILCHGLEGTKIEGMRRNAHVCFQVDSMNSLSSWKSVIVWGQYQELQGTEAMEAMAFYSNRLRPLMNSVSPTRGIGEIHEHNKEGKKSITFRINIEKMSGRMSSEA